MGLYTDGEPRFWLFELIKKIRAKIKADKEWERKQKEGYGKGIKNKEQ